MKSKFLGCCIITALAISSYAWATWVQFGTGETTETTVLESNDSHTIVEFTVPGMDIRDTVVDGTTYQIVSVSTAGIPGEVGKPQTPVINRTVAVDPSKGVELNILEVECDTLSGYYIWPVQEPIPELMGVEPPEFVIDTTAYSQDSFYPEVVADISGPMIWRDYRIVKLHCNPIQFNPVTGELKAYSRIKVSIEYSGTSDENVLDKSPGPTPNYDKLYKDFIINYDFVAPKGPPGEGAYLIITHDNFYDAVLPFAEWKHKKGIRTEVVKFSDINTGAPDSADIHNYIKWAYTNWLAPLEYVLLVGDVELLACGRRPGSDWVPDNLYATDHCYSLIGGDDIFSDVYIGRLPANTVVECSTMAIKLMNYERNPYMTETDWYKSYTGLTAPGYFYTTTLKIADIVENYGYTDIEIILDPPSAEPIMTSINDGCGLFSFRGHGSPGGWGSHVREYINTSHISQLENGRKLPIVIAPTCLANAFNLPYGIYCMGETFVNQAQGAAGYYGATDVTWGGTNDSLAVGVFRGICEEHIYNFQAACDYGKWYMWQYYSDWFAEETIFRMNILGDPSLDMWTDVPQRMVAGSDKNEIPPGEFSDIVVSANEPYTGPQPDHISGPPIPDAYVCLYKEGEILFATAYTNVDGKAYFTIKPDNTGWIYTTVTKHNYKPSETKIAVFEGPPVLSGYISPSHGVYRAHLFWTFNPDPYTLRFYRLLSDRGGEWHTIYTGIETSFVDYYPYEPGEQRTYQVIAYLYDRAACPSNQLTLGMPPRDLYIADVDREDATAFNNGQHIIMDEDGRIHITYTAYGSVWYTYTDDYETFFPPIAIASGEYPTIGIVDNKPALSWVYESDGYGNLYFSRLTDTGWEMPYLLSSEPIGGITAPSMIIKDDICDILWLENPDENLYRAKILTFNCLQPEPEEAILIDEFSAARSPASPALVLNGSKVSLVYDKDGEIYYAEEENGDWSFPINISNSPEYSIHPSISSFGGKIYAVWEEEASGSSTLKYACIGSFGEIHTEVLPTLGDAKFPTLAGPMPIWAEEVGDSNYQIMSYLPSEFGYHIYSYGLTGGEGSSMYPSALYTQKLNDTELHYVWTEKAANGIQPKYARISIEPFPLYQMDAGKSVPSVHTVQREGYKTYGFWAYQTVDYHPDELIYHFDGAKPRETVPD